MAVDYHTSPICPEGALLSFLHHILSSFMLVTPFMFKEYKLYPVLAIFIWSGWKIFGMCITSIKYNEICHKDEKKNFVDLQSIFRQFTTNSMTILLGICKILFCIYNL